VLQNIVYENLPPVIGPVVLDRNEIDEVSGGFPPAIAIGAAIVGGGFTAGYTFGKDRAERNNRRDSSRNRR
jgi:lactobin A/cerein 7B family class IIb bacteriocin